MTTKTGSFNRPWVELEPNRPPKVDDHYKYWGNPPRKLSDRCEYWLRQIVERNWLPNRRWRGECYDCRANWLGVYIWEYQNVLLPILRMKEEALS